MPAVKRGKELPEGSEVTSSRISLSQAAAAGSRSTGGEGAELDVLGTEVAVRTATTERCAARVIMRVLIVYNDTDVAKMGRSGLASEKMGFWRRRLQSLPIVDGRNA